ncbi:hypothetical protein X777_04637 [Ooceraea biroi]|uniref:Uncharacterized protein n=1 Tax=Ooceraea biroi TaxID=2015173 RepID=A0A026X494_OOCBI|nr:hypothetical protein X777_04637 [Ooceraea biroi]
MSGATNDRGEDGARSVVSGETGFAHAGAIVYDQGSYFVVTHCGLFSISTLCNRNDNVS